MNPETLQAQIAQAQRRFDAAAMAFQQTRLYRAFQRWHDAYRRQERLEDQIADLQRHLTDARLAEAEAHNALEEAKRDPAESALKAAQDSALIDLIDLRNQTALEVTHA